MSLAGKQSRAVLRQNQDVLAAGGARDMSFGKVELNIPMAHRRALSLKYPDLDSKDFDTAHKAWMKFLNSSESKPYRVSKQKYFQGADLGQRPAIR